MRIALLGLGRYSGGSPIAFHLAVALAKLHDVRVFLGREALNLAEWKASGLDLDVRPVYSSVGGAICSLVGRRRIRGLARAITMFGPDVLVVPFSHLWTRALLGAVRRPAVVFVHDPEPHPGVAGAIAQVLERRLLQRATHVIVHSSTFLPTMTTVYGLDPARVSVVPIGPLTGYVGQGAVSRAPAGAGRGPRVLFFGRLEPYKGLDVLLDAVPLIRAAVPDAIIRVVGSGGADDFIRRAANTAGVELDPRWVAEAEVPSLFSQADIVVLPYTSATQSGVIPVAAAFALPVVATITGGLPEQLDGGRCGVLVAPSDPSALARAIVDLMKNPSEARRLGDALFHEYATRRCWPAIAQAVTDACRTALSQEH